MSPVVDTVLVRVFEYQGETSYFCAPGLQIQLEKDPTAFLANEAT